MKSPAPAPITFDQELDQLELRIAQRADELARAEPGPSGSMLAWERAEFEIWAATVDDTGRTPQATRGRAKKTARAPMSVAVAE